MRLLHNDAPTDGNGNDAPPVGNTPAAPAPPAATVVANAPTERERQLAAELEAARNETTEERKARVERERTICEMQDEHHRYRKSVEAKPAKAAPKSGWTFFDNN
jgi:hypothetical protein